MHIQPAISSLHYTCWMSYDNKIHYTTTILRHAHIILSLYIGNSQNRAFHCRKFMKIRTKPRLSICNKIEFIKCISLYGYYNYTALYRDYETHTQVLQRPKCNKYQLTKQEKNKLNLKCKSFYYKNIIQHNTRARATCT